MSITALLITTCRQTTAGYGLISPKEQSNIIESRHRTRKVNYISDESGELSEIRYLKQLI